MPENSGRSSVRFRNILLAYYDAVRSVGTEKDVWIANGRWHRPDLPFSPTGTVIIN